VLFCGKHLRFSFPELSSQFQSNFVKIIVGERDFEFAQMNDQNLFKGERITIIKI
jgi:hypothetical protein